MKRRFSTQFRCRLQALNETQNESKVKEKSNVCGLKTEAGFIILKVQTSENDILNS